MMIMLLMDRTMNRILNVILPGFEESLTTWLLRKFNAVIVDPDEWIEEKKKKKRGDAMV